MKFIDSSSHLKERVHRQQYAASTINKLLLFALSATVNIPQLLLRMIFPSSIERQNRPPLQPRAIRPRFTSSRAALSSAYVSIPLLSIPLSLTHCFREPLDRGELDRTSSAQRFFRSRLEFAKRNADRLPVTINHLLQLSILDCEGYRTGSVQDGIRYKEQQQ